MLTRKNSQQLLGCWWVATAHRRRRWLAGCLPRPTASMVALHAWLLGILPLVFLYLLQATSLSLSASLSLCLQLHVYIGYIYIWRTRYRNNLPFAYHVRFLWHVSLAWFCGRRPAHLLAASEKSFRVWPDDVDFNWHMNNSSCARHAPPSLPQRAPLGLTF